MEKKYDIFISYRRSDSKVNAQLLKKVLMSHGYGESDVFLDLHNIDAENFSDRCHDAILKCNSFVLVVSKDSFINKQGEDYYFDEINCALDYHKKIIPVLFDIHLDEQSVPQPFIDKGLNMINALTYSAEYTNDFEEKFIRFVTSGQKKNIGAEIASAFSMPLLIFTLYIGVSLIGVGLRYIWDSHWLSYNSRLEIASSALQRDKEGDYVYVTKDTIYRYTSEGTIDKLYNNYSSKSGLTINIQSSDMYKVGFWTAAVSLVYEISRHNIRPHGGGKKIAAYIAAGLAVTAGFGLGFVIERMIFPVQESKLIRNDLNNVSFWNKMIEKRSIQPWIEQQF